MYNTKITMMQNICKKIARKYLEEELHLQSIKNGCTETLIINFNLMNGSMKSRFKRCGKKRAAYGINECKECTKSIPKQTLQDADYPVKRLKKR